MNRQHPPLYFMLPTLLYARAGNHRVSSFPFSAGMTRCNHKTSINKANQLKKKFSIATLGCKVNQYDSLMMEGLLKREGLVEAEPGEQADVCVINTCSVTAKSDYQSRQLVRRAIKQSTNAKKVIVTGCYAQMQPDELLKIDGVSSVLPNTEKQNITHHIKDGAITDCIIDDNSHEKESFAAWSGASTKRSRAFLRIQEGCDNRCTYCIVWQARGRSRSLPLDRVVAAAREIEAKGFKEIVLTGIHIGFYGNDLGGEKLRLGDLITRLLAATSEVRFRISSIEPNEIDDRLIGMLSGEERLCRHLHIPLQAGSNEILSKMGRKYTAKQYFSLVEQVTERVPGICIGADVIAGFPGETDELFKTSQNAIENSPISYLHVFPFSRRKGTAAYDMDMQVPGREKTERARILRKISDDHKRAFYYENVNKCLNVIIEANPDNSLILKCISDNYLTMLVPLKEIDRSAISKIQVKKEYFRI